jgi:hypothetical protein
MDTKVKRGVFYVVLIGVAALMWAVIQNKLNPTKATYSQFLEQVQAGQMSKATIVTSHSGAASQWIRVVGNASPFLVLLGFWFFMMNA